MYTHTHTHTHTVYARAQGGDDPQRRTRSRQSSSHGKLSINGSVWSTTHTTHASFDVLPQLDDDFASTVPENSITDHSTFIPSVGELSSTAVIPLHARDDYHITLGPEDTGLSPEHKLTKTQPHSNDIHIGTHNPLAVVVDFEGEAAITSSRNDKPFPPLEAIDACEPNARTVYNNPIYAWKQEKNASSYKDSTHSMKAPKSSSMFPNIMLNSRNTSTLHNEPDIKQQPYSTLLEGTSEFVRGVNYLEKKGNKPTTRASARTFHEVELKLASKRPPGAIPSSRSFVDTPLADQEYGPSHISTCDDSDCEHSSSTLQPASLQLSTPVTPSLQSVHSSQSQPSPVSSPTSYSSAKIPLSPSDCVNVQSPNSTNSVSDVILKQSVQELHERFELFSTSTSDSLVPASTQSTHTSPSSPVLFSSTQNCTDTDSGRESMLEPITDIDSAEF